MRYLLDTNIVVYLTTDFTSLNRDVQAILSDYDNTLCISAETTRELIVGYRKHSFATKYWKSCEELIDSITSLYHIEVLPITKEVAKTHARLTIDEQHGHIDPSDHIIISHAITLGMPLISSDRRFEFYRNQGLDLIFNKK